jgi:dTMP kinase
MANRGIFVTLEGGEGAGKSTQAAALKSRLEAFGRLVVQVREPGGTKFGEDLRELLLSSSKLATRTEMLLFMAARSELVDKVIRPALESGIDVICDRFIDSTTAYQGYGRGLDLALIETMNNAVIEDCRPDLTVLLDVDPDIGLTRVTTESAGDAIEGHWQAGLSLDSTNETKPKTAGRRVGGRDRRFHQRVRKGYQTMAKAEPNRWLTLDAASPQGDIAAAIWCRLEPLLISRTAAAD